jgi:hypothetical protein
MASRTTVTDEIYRAAIETAGHLGSPVEAGAAMRALAYELELRGLAVTLSPAGEGLASGRTLLVDGSDGVCVGAAGETSGEYDLGDMLRRNHWQHAHEIVFTPGSLHIKSVAN